MLLFLIIKFLSFKKCFVKGYILRAYALQQFFNFVLLSLLVNLDALLVLLIRIQKSTPRTVIMYLR